MADEESERGNNSKWEIPLTVIDRVVDTYDGASGNQGRTIEEVWDQMLQLKRRDSQ